MFEDVISFVEFLCQRSYWVCFIFYPSNHLA